MKYLQQIWRWLILLFIYLFIGVYALAFPSDTGWFLFIFATLVVLTEAFSLVGALQNIQFSAQSYLLVHAGKSVPVKIKMRKHRGKILWLANLQLSSSQYLETFTYLFYHGQQKQLRVTWKPQARGPVKKQTIHLVGSDLFGWFKKEAIHRFTVDWLVLPPVHPLNKQASYFFQKKLSSNAQNFGEHSFKIKKFRPYQPGDRLGQVDWKISSKQQELILREYEQKEPSETILLFYGANSPYFEHLLSLFYSLWQELLNQDVRFVLLGQQVSDQMRITEEDFAFIQPLEQEVKIPDFGQKQVILFVPEINLQPTTLRPIQVYDYQQLLQQLKE
ncbi:DUF58 domain-containing protein [Tetragenococcus koreensis]|uniref:DUF58 domain-containing protein n=1 Tax=Tetragenococcus koreensis TaxID=290335 RepID=A0AAN4RJ35_9ENTE|nr:DUF58 domain-containing protein [Tetragenococcus koreensis]AYW45965.1 hypothetical protein C7K43_08390 [Tetragenococcus koreensis]MCF1616863.1 DUF58 domain-containing protein [Tetragenococcus koreensis]MCF1621335.1 DUF58 domain-containing protein [Tetragenococcus koreensis]MCF1626415.1 DUF58 domain-containing protein [Tetragenococcus koreensis]MCF1632392.1 DUF58 domain-containing protein [Tetragenococcus koreensis]